MRPMPQESLNYYFSSEYLGDLRLASYSEIIRVTRKVDVGEIAEIGVGPGILPAMLKALGESVSTIDHSGDLNPDIICDVRELANIHRCFDKVICSQVLEHLPYEDFSLAIEQLLSIGKKLVLSHS